MGEVFVDAQQAGAQRPAQRRYVLAVGRNRLYKVRRFFTIEYTTPRSDAMKRRNDAMNSRERMLAAIRHQPVDRVPTDIWATSEVMAKLRQHFGEGVDVLTALHIDGMKSTWADYIGPPLPAMPEGESVDSWGIRRKRVTHPGGTYDEQSFYPLAFARTMDDLDRYAWPTTDWFDYSQMRARAEAGRATHVVSCGYQAPFYYHNLLRGLEQSLVDPYESPELAHEIVRRISEFFLAHHRRMFEACDGLIDVTQVTDDLGSQTGPIIGMDLYQDLYAPWHRKMIALAHEFGIKVMHHDDGSCRIFIPSLVEMGVDILNPVQWRCPGMDMLELKAQFGRRLCFHGAIENQQIIPFGTPEEVRAEVRHCIDALASDGTGYILAPCHNLQGITPVENVLALYDEAWRYWPHA
jgi:uroporphyrinogen decarboxylase